MSGNPITDRRSIRRQATKAEIVAAAWELAREHGLAGIALRELGDRVGMKAQSLYSYFGSKLEIYDAMFLEGYQAFAEWMADPTFFDEQASVPENLRRGAHRFFDFCTQDPVRYQLLFQRTIPEFVPSDEAYAVATSVYRARVERMAEVGISDPETHDVWTAIMTGLTDQQISNDPGGVRWKKLVDRTVDSFVLGFAPELADDESWATHRARLAAGDGRPPRAKVGKTHQTKRSGGNRVARATGART